MSWCDKIVKWLQTTTLRHLQLQICVSENKRNQTILKWIQIQLQLYKISCSLSWYTSAVKWSYMQFNKFSMSFFFFFVPKPSLIQNEFCDKDKVAILNFWWNQNRFFLVSEALLLWKALSDRSRGFKNVSATNVFEVQKKSFYRLWTGHKKNTESLFMKPLWIFSRLISVTSPPVQKS